MTNDPIPADGTVLFGPRVSKDKHYRQSKLCIFVGMLFLLLSFASHIFDVYFQSKIAVLNAKRDWDATMELWYRICSGFATFGLWISVLMLFQAVIQIRRSLLIGEAAK